MKAIRLFMLLVLCGLMSACGTVSMGAPQASMDNIRALRAAALAPAMVGAFAPSPELDGARDASIGVRAHSLRAPNGSFAGYLKETLAAELGGAGLLDGGADRVIEGQLTDCQLDASIGTGRGRLAAHIVVRRAGQPVFERDIAVDSTWESSFVGAVAIPAAINEFTSLFRKMVGELVADGEFRRAMMR